MQLISKRTLAAVGALTGTLAVPAFAYAQNAPAQLKAVPSKDVPAPFTGKPISFAEAEKLGYVEQRAAVYPEIPDGQKPSASARALRAGSTCDYLRQCAFTGGYYSGPIIQWYAGHPESFWDGAQSACTSSGTSGAIWKNCASSIDNDNPTYGFTVANNSGDYASGSYKTVEADGYRDTLGSFNNNIEKSVGY